MREEKKDTDRKKQEEKEAKRMEEAVYENDIYTNELLKEILKQLKVASKPAVAVGGAVKSSLFKSAPVQTLPHPEDMKGMDPRHAEEIEKMRREGVKNRSVGGRVGNLARWSQERAEQFAGAADNTFQRAASQKIVQGVGAGVSMLGKAVSKKWGINFEERIPHKTEQQKSAEKGKDVSLRLDSDTKKAISSIDSNVQQIAKSVKSIDDLMIENALDRLEREKESTQDIKEVDVKRSKLEGIEKASTGVIDKLFGMADAIDDVMDILKFFKKGKGGGLSIPGTAGGGFGAGGFGDASDEILNAPDAPDAPDAKKKPGKMGRFKNVAKAVLGRGKGLAVRGAGMLARGAIMGAPAAAVAASGYAGYKAGQWLNENTSIQENIANGIENTQNVYSSAVDMTSRGIETGVNAYKSAVDMTSSGIESGVNAYKSAVDTTSQAIESGVNAYRGAVDMTSQGIESGVNAVKGGYQSAVNATSQAIETGAGALSSAAGAASKGWDSTKEFFGASKNVAEVIKQAADRVGVDYGTLMAFAKQESGFNPNAKAKTSSATGLFQFIKGTWADMVRKYGKQYGIGIGDVSDPLANATMGALFVKENSEFLAKKGIPVNGTSLYAAHFLGPGGAAKLFGADPNADAAALMPDAARANRNIFYDKSGKARTVDAVIQTLFNKVGKNVDAFSAAAKGMTGGGGAMGGGGASGSFEAPSKTQTNAQAAGAAKLSTNTTQAAVKTSMPTQSRSMGGGGGTSTPSQSSAKTPPPAATPGPTRSNSPLKTLQEKEMTFRMV